MKVLRDPQILRGYLIEQPFDGLRAITHCGEALCVRGHNLPPHRHRAFELLLLTGGRASWLIGRQEVAQRVGDLVVTLPGQLHRTGPRPNPENQHLWLGVDLAALGGVGQKLARHLLNGRLQLLPGCGDLEPLLRGVMAQAIARQPQAARVARRYLDLVVALLWQRVEAAAAAEPVSDLAPCSLPVQRGLAYLEAHLGQRIPLEEVARVAAIRNVTHFCTRFRREVGMAPAAMHRRLRLDAAKRALGQADAAVTMVAHQFGFSSSQHFSGAFRAAFGVTPSQWRASLLARPRVKGWPRRRRFIGAKPA